MDQFDAVVLCTGATWPRDLPIPGRHLDGIYFAMNFLESSQKKQLGGPTDLPLLAKDKDIIVIGGGDTGCDCIATSLRQVSVYFKSTIIYTITITFFLMYNNIREQDL